MSKSRLRSCTYGCLLLYFLLFFLMFSFPTFAAESQSKTVRVGWYEDSYNITGKHGERSGYNYEYEQAVAAYTGWTYEYIEAGWPELMEMMQKGEIDLMGDVSYTEERAETMLYSELPMGQEKYYLYADLKNTDISALDLTTLNGKRIGLLEGSVQATQFYEWEKEHHLHLQHVFIKGREDSQQKMADHELDCVVATETPLWSDAGMSTIATIGESGIYFVINKNRPDLKESLDTAMRKMENDNPFYADELYKKYLLSVSTPVLSSEEQDWLKQHGKIRIGYLKHDSGFSDVEPKTGVLTGVINDYVKFAADCLGEQCLKFQLLGFDTQAEEIQALQDGTIDLVFRFSQNPYVAEQKGVILSNTVMEVPLAAVTARYSFDEGEKNTVAIEKGNLSLKWHIAYYYANWDIVEYDSVEDAEKAVRDGLADCFLTKAGQLKKYMEDSKLRCIFLIEPYKTSFAVKRENTVLLSILNKTLQTLQSSMLTGALSMYDNRAQKVTVMDFIKDNLQVVATVFLATFALILIVVLGLLRKARIAEEKAKNAQLEAENANAAKSTFLFNMSHDIRTPMNALLGYNQLMKKELTDPKLLDYEEKIEQSGTLLLSIINHVLDMARIESGKMELDENYCKVGDILKEVCGSFEVEAKKKEISLTYETKVEHKHILCDITKVQEILLNLISNAVNYTPAGGTVNITSQELPCDQEGFVRIQTEVMDNGIGISKAYLPIMFDSFTRERNTTMGKVAGTGLGMPIVKKMVAMMGGSIEVESEVGKGSKFTLTLQHRIADKRYYEQQPEGSPVVNKTAVLKGKRILLAEDNDLNAEIAMTLLEDIGLEIHRVEDGVQCVTEIEQQPAGSYDLILMDIQMPNMDGYKATQTIRALADQEKAKIPIVAMTANAFEEDKKMAFSMGMNGHIAKPISIEKVEEVLISILTNDDK